jgi:hypothetical protein
MGRILRRGLKVSLLVATIVLSLKSGLHATTATWLGQKVQHSDISYDLRSREALKKLDIYTFKRARNLPVMVYVHGGGWQKGDKSAVHLKADFFNDKKYVFVSVNYRLVPDIEFPANVYDVAKAVVWVKRNISKYGGNPNKIFTMGHSAGAHLVTLVSTDGKYLESFGSSNSIITATISNDTKGYDITEVITQGGPIRKRIYITAFGLNPKVWREASPINHVSEKSDMPDMLILYASETSGSASHLFASELLRFGKNVKVVGLLNESHMTINKSIGIKGAPTTKVISRFLNSY